MHSAITIDALRVLDAIDRKGSFAGAADELFRVPSAISYTIQKLEDDLDLAIFDRSGHRARLTEAGQYLLQEGRALLEATDALAHATKQVAQGWETRLRIAFNTLLPTSTLYSAIDDFYSLGLPVEIQIMEEVFGGAWDALQSRRADLVFGADMQSRPAGPFETRPLGQVPFVYAVASDHPLCSEEGPITDTMASQYPAIVAADSSRHLPPATAGIFSNQRTLTVGNMEQKIQAQAAGLGVGWLPEPRIRRELETGVLVELEMERPRRSVDLHMARHQDDQGKAMTWFWDKLSDPDQFAQWLNPFAKEQ